MSKAITTLPPDLATIRRGVPHSVPIVYTDDLGRFLPLAGQTFTFELRANRALDSTLLATYTATVVNTDYGQLKADLASTSGLLAGEGWLTGRVNGTSTNGIDVLILDAPVKIV